VQTNASLSKRSEVSVQMICTVCATVNATVKTGSMSNLSSQMNGTARNSIQRNTKYNCRDRVSSALRLVGVVHRENQVFCMSRSWVSPYDALSLASTSS